MNYYLVAQIVKSSNEYKLSGVSIRQYTHNPALNSIIVDYRVATRASDKYPFIIGKCNISTPNERNIITKSLNTNATFDTLKSFQRLFPDGFMIDSNCSTEEELKEIIPEEMKINKTKVLWNVGF